MSAPGPGRDSKLVRRENPWRALRAFVKIAIAAGKGKIVDVIATAVNFGNDMFDMERVQR